MVLGYIILPGLILAMFLMYFGFKLGENNPNWFVRLLSPLLAACGLAAMFFVGAECNPLYSDHPVLNNLIAAFGICAMTSGGSAFVASTLSSKIPQYNALLPQNENNPSYKRAVWLLVLTAFIIGVPAMMLGIVLYHGEFVAGHLFLIAVPTALAGLTISAARAQLGRPATRSQPPLWTLHVLVIVLVVLLIACFKGPGLLFIFLASFVFLGTGRAR
ncbi:MAG: hypothetical protein K2W95_25225 [Candidatus Obscuribacterales bacterium]|nr:hypothetical protein [Candidatus Obscuribacterales bacterium]